MAAKVKLKIMLCTGGSSHLDYFHSKREKQLFSHKNKNKNVSEVKTCAVCDLYILSCEQNNHLVLRRGWRPAGYLRFNTFAVARFLTQ